MKINRMLDQRVLHLTFSGYGLWLMGGTISKTMYISDGFKKSNDGQKPENIHVNLFKSVTQRAQILCVSTN